LSEAERRELTTIVKKLKGTSEKVKLAIVLLKADADGSNWTNEQIRDLTGLSLQGIVNIRKKLVLEGFDIAIERQKRRLPPVPKKLDGLQEAKIIAMRCGAPPEGFGQWSLRLLIVVKFCDDVSLFLRRCMAVG